MISSIEVFSQTQRNAQPEEWNNEAITAAEGEIHKLPISLGVANYKLLKFHPPSGSNFKFQLFNAIWYSTITIGMYT